MRFGALHQDMKSENICDNVLIDLDNIVFQLAGHPDWVSSDLRFYGEVQAGTHSLLQIEVRNVLRLIATEAMATNEVVSDSESDVSCDDMASHDSDGSLTVTPLFISHDDEPLMMFLYVIYGLIYVVASVPLDMTRLLNRVLLIDNDDVVSILHSPLVDSSASISTAFYNQPPSNLQSAVYQIASRVTLAQVRLRPDQISFGENERLPEALDSVATQVAQCRRLWAMYQQA